jgi:hypothetical protein
MDSRLYADVLQRIERAVPDVETLPVPSDAEPPASDVLPIAADAATPDAGKLPAVQLEPVRVRLPDRASKHVR